jgi:hypothetical protein
MSPILFSFSLPQLQLAEEAEVHLQAEVAVLHATVKEEHRFPSEAEEGRTRLAELEEE